MTLPANRAALSSANRTFHPDNWPAWIEEVESLWGSRITDGPMVDDLYNAYLADDTPVQAVFALRGLQGGSAPIAPVLERLWTRTAYVEPPPRYTLWQAVIEVGSLALLLGGCYALAIWQAGR